MRRFLPLFAMIPLTLASLLHAADDDGLDALREATRLKLNAKSLADTEKVIALCEEALEQGLEPADKAFAKKLLVGALWRHASQVTAPLLRQRRPIRGWEQLRAIANQDLEKLIEHDDSFVDAYMMLARLQALPNGDRIKARMAIDRAVELADDDARKKSEALLYRAAMRQDPDDRLEDLNQAIKVDPTYLNALQARAQFYVGQGKIEQAISDLEQMLENDPDNVAVLRALAEALTSIDRFDAALERLAKAIEINPDQAANYMLRAAVYEAMEKPQQAIEDLTKTLELAPDELQPLLDRARLYYLTNDLEKARIDIDRAVQDAPDELGARLLRSIIAEAEGRFRQAIGDLELIISANPDRTELQLELARLLMRDERPRNAIRVLTRVIESDEDNWQALRTRGDALLSVGKHAEAIEDYNKALELQPENDGILNNLAWVLATSPFDELRDAKRSIKLATKACQLTKFEMPHILSTLAAGYAEDGNFEKAIEWSQKAVEKGKTDLPEQVDQLEKELESYRDGKPWRELQEVKDKPDPPRKTIET